MNKLAALALAPCLALSLGAQTVTLKLATLVPQNSSWFRILQEMGTEWEKASGGRVKVVFYPGGRMGDDNDVIRKMRLGQLQGAVLASPGLAEIDRSVYALSIPLAFESTDEVYRVLDRLRPGLERTFESKGFVVLNWADGGWVRFFARRPVAGPEDLKAQKFFQWQGDTHTLEIWKTAGFNTVPAPAPELTTGLQTGLLDAFLTSPQVVLIMRYFEKAPHMTDLRWAMIMAGTVVRKDAWEKVPADVRPALLKAAQDAAGRLRRDMAASEATDIEALKRAGLKVVPVDARARTRWEDMLRGAHGKIRGAYVSAQAYDEAMAIRDELRKGGRR
ncbi:MAG TPA: TRAP transporter substrate-binding protein DctP [Holophaga sp.]|nr:TRAP transporter substrate-binding protein DctP [Holophaga sp.]